MGMEGAGPHWEDVKYYLEILICCLLPFFIHGTGRWPRKGSCYNEDDTGKGKSSNGPF